MDDAAREPLATNERNSAVEYLDPLVKVPRRITHQRMSSRILLEDPAEDNIQGDRKFFRRTTIRGRSVQTAIKNTQKSKYRKIFGNGLFSLVRRMWSADRENEAVRRQLGQYQVRVNNLLRSSQELLPPQRLEKAVRHFQDALYLRYTRNDFDFHRSAFIYLIYYIQSHRVFQGFLYLLSLTYTFMTFWEPTNRYDTYQVTQGYYVLEVLILSMFAVDFVLESFHLIFDLDRSFHHKYLENYRWIWAGILELVLIADAFYFYNDGNQDYNLRFARPLRPFLMVLYSMELKRKLKSILKSMQQIIQLFIFFFTMIIFFAAISLKAIGDLDQTEPYDHISQNYTNFLSATSILYIVASPDYYPACMLPAYEQSEYYLIFFVGYIILFQMFFLPIPVAIVFEAYKAHRGEIMIADRLKQREGLLASFIALDYEENKKITDKRFTEFMSLVYLRKKRYIKRIPKLFAIVDINQDRQISINEFFDLIDHMEQDSTLWVPSFPNLSLWLIVRSIINQYLRFKDIAKSHWFELVMFLVVTLNTVTIFILIFSNDQDVIDKLSAVDDICLYFYIAECVIKLIGFGIEKYFEDEWNTFDFIMVLLSLLSDFILSFVGFIKGAKSLRSSKLIKISRLRNLFKACRTVRSVKIINFLILGADTLLKIKFMVSKIFVCIPLIFQFFPALWIVYYVYAIFGMEFFDAESEEESHFNEHEYAEFSSFGGALLLLFQIMLNIEWGKIVFDYAQRYGSLGKAVGYFISFHIVIQFIFLALLKGIIWEIFTVVEYDANKNEEAKEQQASEEGSDSEYLESEAIVKRQGTFKVVSPNVRFSRSNSGKRKDRKNTRKLKNSQVNFNEAMVYDKFLVNLSMPNEDDIPRESGPQRVPSVRAKMDRRESYSKQDIDSIYEPIVRSSSRLLENIESIQHRFSMRKAPKHNSQMQWQDDTTKVRKMIMYLVSRTTLLTELKTRDPNFSSSSRKLKVGDMSLKFFDSDDDDEMNTYNNQILKTFAYDTKPVEESETGEKMQNYFYKKALLKDANLDRLKQLEYNFFQSFYGKLFDESKDLHLQPLLKLEALMLHNFEKLLRFNYNDVSALVQLLNVIEINISSFLLRKGSVMKFLFRDQFGNWIFFSTDAANLVHPLKAEKGPWIISDQLMRDEIYICPDFFYPSNDYLVSTELSGMFETFEELSKSTLSDGDFSSLDIQRTVMYHYVVYLRHLLMTVSDMRKISYVQETTRKQLKLQHELPLQVTQVAAIILVNAGEAKEEDNRQQRISFFRPPQTNQPSRQKARHIHMNMMKQQVLSEHEKIDENLHLPFPYVAELMRSLQNILLLDSDRLIIKINQYLNNRFLQMNDNAPQGSRLSILEESNESD